jgi:hypothetical protein
MTGGVEMIRGGSARKRGQHIRNARIVSECLADMREAVSIPRAEDEARTELERIFAEFVLSVSGGVGAFARDSIVTTQ